MTKKVFVTGGAGYVGSHTCVELLKKNYDVTVFDDFSNSSKLALERVELLTNRKVNLLVGDITNQTTLNEALAKIDPDCVVHFAGLKSVAESTINPLAYYDVNVRGSINLLNAMAAIGCTDIVFSSSATVYGETNVPPYDESMPTLPVSPYGKTKQIFENILQDWVKSSSLNRAVVLRYFNPVGAHDSGLIGEDPRNKPNNLMPTIIEAAKNKLSTLSICGSDYDTRDGTGERDYIHVVDLAHGHLKAIENINLLKQFEILNLGTGRGTTVLELITTFEKVNSIPIAKRFVERRPGDVAKSLADPTLARELIGFECKKSMEDMCLDTWNWARKNPNGYD